MRIILSTECILPRGYAFKQNEWTKSGNNSNLGTTIQKMVGHRISDSAVVKNEYYKPNAPYKGGTDFENLRLFTCRGTRAVLTFELQIGSEKDATTLRNLSDPIWNAVEKLGLTIARKKTISAICGVILNKQDQTQVLLSEGILVFTQSTSSRRFISTLASEIVSRVAIERSTLGFAISPPKSKILFFGHAAYAGYLVRRWPVQLLTDRKFIATHYKILRKGSNLENVRAEVLERAKAWWSVLASVFAFISILAAIILQGLFPGAK